MRRHFVDFEAITFLMQGTGDQTGERFIYGLLPVEPIGCRSDFSSHIVEGPAQGREFFFKIVRIEAALHRYPAVGVRLAAGAESRRQERTFLN